MEKNETEQEPPRVWGNTGGFQTYGTMLPGHEDVVIIPSGIAPGYPTQEG